MRKTWLLVLTIAVVVCTCIVLAACGAAPNTPNPDNNTTPDGNNGGDTPDPVFYIPTGLTGAIKDMRVDVDARLITATMAADVDNFALSQLQFDAAEADYTVYTDAALTKAIVDSITLVDGDNVFYLLIHDDNGTTQYTIIITREVATKHLHTYGEWIVTSEPTCTRAGSRIKSCDCGDFVTEDIPAKGHTEVIDAAVSPTCTTTGLTEGKHCYYCDKVLLAQVIVPTLEHIYGEWTKTKNATCSEIGEKVRTCTKCSNKQTSEIPVLEHQWGEIIDCTQGGTCTLCGAHLTWEHDLVVQYTKPVCCTENGIGYVKCTRCNYQGSEASIEAIGHHYMLSESKTSTCIEEGYLIYTCTNCNSSYTERYSLLTHTTGDGICTMCGQTITLLEDEKAETIEYFASLKDSATYASESRDAYLKNAIERVKSQCGVSYLNSYSWYSSRISSLTQQLDTADSNYNRATMEGNALDMALYQNLMNSISQELSNAYTLQTAAEWQQERNSLPAQLRNELSSLESQMNAALREIENKYKNYGQSAASLVSSDYTGLKLVLQNSSYVVTGYVGAIPSTLTIPTQFNGVNIIGIADNAFANEQNITCVTLASTIQTIGEKAFYGCSELRDVITTANHISAAYAAFVDTQYIESEVFGHQLNTYTQLATCIEDGYTYQWCSNCNYRTENTILEMLPHNLIDVAAQEMSCLQDGEAAYSYCIDCAYTTYDLSKHIPKKPHDYQPTVTSPTCGTDGYTTYTCSECGTSYTDDIVAATKAHTFANSFCTVCGADDGLVYLMKNDTYCVIDYTGEFGTIVIPESYLGYPVTEIESKAFESCNQLLHISIGDNVVLINSGAFSNCSALESVTFGSSVTTIGSGAFKGCNGLSFISIPSNVTAIMDSVFYNCSGLASITIPSSITSIGKSTFYGCSGLATIAFAEDSQLSTIGDSAFYGCNELISIAFPASVTSIGKSAFSGCSGLTTVIFSEGVASIGGSAFANCTKLGAISIPTSVSYISSDSFSNCYGIRHISANPSISATIAKYCNSRAYSIVITSEDAIRNRQFYGYSGLTAITIPDSVTSIGDCAFYDCRGLTTVVFADDGQLSTIGNSAFYGCSELTAITIPDSVTSIGEGAFAGCDRLYSITIPFIGSSKSDSIASRNTLFGYIFGMSNYTGATTQYYSSSESGISFKIPYELKSVTVTGGNILYGAFYNCNHLISVVIGSAVTSIDTHAFYNCSKLSSVIIGSGVTTIGYSAFENCSELSSVIIGSGVTTIGSSAFENCTGLVSVSFAEQIQLAEIGSYAFKNCLELTSISIPDSVTSIGENAFNWCSKLPSITIPDGVTTISASMFSVCNELSTVTLPSNLVSIEYGAFQSCAKLASISIPESVTSIGEIAFSGCSGLTSVAIPEGVTSIGRSAFSLCTNLTSITIPDSVTSIGENAFNWCNGLTFITGNTTNAASVAKQCKSSAFSVTITSGESISDSAFGECSGLTSITIAQSVTSIGGYAFYDCNKLTTVTIEGIITSIGRYAFDRCFALTLFDFNGTMEQWSAIIKGSWWNYRIGDYTIHCTDGDIAK